MTGEIRVCGPKRRPIPIKVRGQHLVVDMHCHFSVSAADALVHERRGGAQPPPRFSNSKTDEVNALQYGRIGRTLSSVEQRLSDMDRLGVDVQAMSPSPTQYFYHTDPETGRAAARLINDAVANAVASRPDRLVGLGTVPLQNPEMAVAEMRRCVSELDLRGIEICSNVNGQDLHAEALRPFWAAAEALETLILIHPLGFSEGKRMTEHYFNNLIGNPLESALAVGHLIFGGVLDRHPGLRICVAHGGGYLPAYWGRMDHGWHAREDCREHCVHPPSTYLRKLWFDTLVFDQDQLDSLVRTHGADRLCLGSDYPFDMGESDPVGFHQRLNDADRRKILGENAAQLLGLTCDVGGDEPSSVVS